MINRTDGRIAVLGANGQVGGDVMLLLRTMGVSAWGAARSSRGSAFLRLNGIETRHGDPAEPEAATRLMADATVIANLALAIGTPAEMREGNEAIIRTTMEQMPPTATYVFFSTQVANPTCRPEDQPARLSDYGREKRRNERQVARLADKLGRRFLVVRLGHFTGPLQGLSRNIGQAVRTGPIQLPALDRLANVTDSRSIAEMLAAIAHGAPIGNSGPLDLADPHPRTWRDVLDAEAARQGVTLQIEQSGVAPPVRQSIGQRTIGWVGRSQRAKAIGTRLLAALSSDWNLRAKALHSIGETGAEIAQLERPNLIEATLYPGGTGPSLDWSKLKPFIESELTA